MSAGAVVLPSTALLHGNAFGLPLESRMHKTALKCLGRPDIIYSFLFIHLKFHLISGMMVHTCNPSYSGGISRKNIV
jgi:hypothetical protein